MSTTISTSATSAGFLLHRPQPLWLASAEVLGAASFCRHFVAAPPLRGSERFEGFLLLAFAPATAIAQPRINCERKQPRNKTIPSSVTIATKKKEDSYSGTKANNVLGVSVVSGTRLTKT